jgi:hypothetical protein
MIKLLKRFLCWSGHHDFVFRQVIPGRVAEFDRFLFECLDCHAHEARAPQGYYERLGRW